MSNKATGGGGGGEEGMISRISGPIGSGQAALQTEASSVVAQFDHRVKSANIPLLIPFNYNPM